MSRLIFATDSGQINSINSITFTPGDWSDQQTITVESVDDQQITGDRESSITHTASSVDGNYDGIEVAEVTVNIAENDAPGVVIAEATNLQIAEDGATGSYTIALITQPQNDVTISFDAGADIDFIDPITFTPGDWDEPQTVNLIATLDTEVEPTEIHDIVHILSSDDGNYDGLAVENVSVAVEELSFDNTEMASGLNESLASIQDTIDAQFAAIELPIIGSLETLAPDLIGGFQDTLVNQIQTSGALNADDLSDLLETTIEDALGVDVTVAADLSLEEATFDITIAKTYDLASIALDADLGLPGLGIEVGGSADLTFDYELGLGFWH